MTTLTDGQQAVELLQRAVHYAQTNDDVYLRSYSGRYMYGRECPSISGDSGDLLKVLIKAALLDSEIFEELELSDICQDSMGMGTVWYWTHLDIDGVVFEDEDEDY